MDNEPMVLYPGSINEMSFQCTECKGVYKIKWEPGEFIITCGCDKTQGVRIKLAEREPTAGDRETAEALADELAEKAIGIYIKPYVNDFGKEVRSGWDKIIDIIADALSAARGNRKALEDELKKWHEIGRRAKRNLDAPFTAENPVQILVDAAALAAILEVKDNG